jgi:AmpD protein
MTACIKNGWLQTARRLDSPNCDARPAGVDADLVVIHGISLPPGEFGGPWIDALFTNSLPVERHPYFRQIAELRVSAHLLIRRDGETVQYVPFHRRAWHAGRSRFSGRENCNDFGIGIELEGTDYIPYTGSQYSRLSTVITTLISAYSGITSDRITGHAQIAPGRKTDPGPVFDWARLHRELACTTAE